MRKQFDWKWEELDEYTFRAKVIGGWLVHCACSKNKSESLVFVADRDHEWHILPPKVEPKQEVGQFPPC